MGDHCVALARKGALSSRGRKILTISKRLYDTVHKEEQTDDLGGDSCPMQLVHVAYYR
jgi:hypothetical protein